MLTCVGVIWLMSSDASCFRSVVFPALSKPRRRSLTSWSGALFNLRKIESKPLNNHEEERLLWGTDFAITEHLFLEKKFLVVESLIIIILYFNVIYSICFSLLSFGRSRLVSTFSNLINSMAYSCSSY